MIKFNAAIVRRPAKSVCKGLRASDADDPDFEGVVIEHNRYVDALKSAGLEVTILDPLEAFPDSIFVEDPALVFPDFAVLLRPGARSRLGEAAALAPALRAHFDELVELAVGYVDGVHEAEIDLKHLHANRHVVFGISNSRLGEADRAATTAGFARDILPAFADGQVRPRIDRIFGFDELPAAKAHLESDTQVGKIVVRVQ